MRLTAVTLIAIMVALAQDDGKALFQQGVDKLQGSGSLAQEGKFTEANALIAVDPEEAQRTVGLLSDISRYAFSTAQAEAVPLAREIEVARCYLEIEKARFRDRLHFELPDATAASDISVPSLTLQPRVENAVPIRRGE